MATLTSTGIDCSNGTLDGQYTGTANNNTSFPIGSYLFLSTQGSDPGPALNASVVFKAATPYYQAGTTPTVAGTWRSRGAASKVYQCATLTLGYLMQRTA